MTRCCQVQAGRLSFWKLLLSMPTATSEPSARPAKQERVSRAIIVGYALPMLGVGYMFGVLTLYLLKFATDVLLVAPGTMGLILGISRIWDAFADPLAGYLSDATRTRFGRRRPWLTASALPLGLFFVAVWSPPSQLGGGSEGRVDRLCGRAFLLCEHFLLCAPRGAWSRTDN